MQTWLVPQGACRSQDAPFKKSRDMDAPLRQAPTARKDGQFWDKEMEVNFIQDTIILAILAFLILCITIRPLREWLFGSPEIDASKGFPWSRKKHQWTKHVLSATGKAKSIRWTTPAESPASSGFGARTAAAPRSGMTQKKKPGKNGTTGLKK
jgi:hypothetical protein